MDKADQARMLEHSKYDRIVIYLFRTVTDGLPQPSRSHEIAFDLDAVRAAMNRAVADGVIDKAVKNIADVKYTYDARRELPEEVAQYGPVTWLQNGKGTYKFRWTRRPNIIDLPRYFDKQLVTESVVDQTPPFISALLGGDEQAVFTRVRNAHLISQFLGFPAWPIQGHHRTTVTYGQIEIDEVQAGLDGEAGTIVPISGKGGQDKLSWSQALNLNTYGAEKAPIPGLAVRSLGLWRDSANTVWIVEFTPHTEIDEIEIANVRRFRFR